MFLKYVFLSAVAGVLAVNTAFGQAGPPRPGQPPPGQNPPGQNPPGQNPPGQNPPGQNPPQNPGANTPPPAPTSGLGAPLTGLNGTQLAAFNAGRNDFFAVETPASGLGPIFNDSSCVNCHQSPEAGGTNGAPRSNVIRFGRVVNGQFDAMEMLGGSLLQNRSINPAVIEVIPAGATLRATRITTPLFGAGLIEAIPDATIQALANQSKPDGVRGRAAVLIDIGTNQSRVGRFGWKAQQATLRAFSADAYLNELGITNSLSPAENAPNGNLALLAQINNRVTIVGLQAPANPATGLSKVERAADFMRFLAPPPVRSLTASATSGQAIFQQLGCATCHTPSMLTAATAPAPLANQTVRLYSDLLLHDMGSLNDGIAQGNATGREMKTAPLWGLKARPTWLHDGRARTVEAAIIAHDGEGAISRGRFQQLANNQRQQLMDFLNGL